MKPLAANPGPGTRLTVASYNIRSCRGIDRRTDPGRIAAVIGAMNADIVALQEVDTRRRMTDGLDVFVFFRDHLGGHAAEAKSIATADGDYGHMVLSRWPLRRDKCPMRLPLRPLLNPAPQHGRVALGQLPWMIRRRHPQVGIIRSNPRHQIALLRIARNNGSRLAQRQQSLLGIQPLIRLAASLIRPVTGEARV